MSASVPTEPTGADPQPGRPWPPPGPDTAWWRDETVAPRIVNPPETAPPAATGPAPAGTAFGPGNPWSAPTKTDAGTAQPSGPAQPSEPAGQSDTAQADGAADTTVTMPAAEAPTTGAEAVDASADTVPPVPAIEGPKGSRNEPPTGFPHRRLPGSRTRPMPDTASPADAAARSAAARATTAPAPRRDEPSRALVPRPETAGDALDLFFEPAEPPAPARDGTLAEAPWPAPAMRVPGGGYRIDPRPAARPRKLKDPRSPAVGLTALVLFAFVATFFAWFSAGPLWLTLGHGRAGTATVADCPVAGIDKRCADFTASDNSFSTTVTLLGPASEHVRTGTKLPARMVSGDATTAYAGDPASLYLRWGPGLLIVLLCGFGIAWATGTLRLPGRRARVVTFATSVLAPIALVLGMLAATY